MTNADVRSAGAGRKPDLGRRTSAKTAEGSGLKSEVRGRVLTGSVVGIHFEVAANVHGHTDQGLDGYG